IERGTLADLVSGDEQCDATLQAAVSADPAYQRVVLARCVERHGERVRSSVVDDTHASRARQHVDYLLWRHRPRELGVDRFAMGAKHRYPHARRAYREVRGGEDLARLEGELALFAVVAVCADVAVVTEQVEGDRVLELPRHHALTCQRSSGLVAQFPYAGCPSS